MQRLPMICIKGSSTVTVGLTINAIPIMQIKELSNLDLVILSLFIKLTIN